jgi:prevent-host-death family protein
MEDSVNIHAAKTHLSRLVERVEAGEQIVIARAGRPIARLVPYAARARPGLWKGRVTIAPDFDAPIPEIDEGFSNGAARPDAHRASEAPAPYAIDLAAPVVRGGVGHSRLPAIVGRIVHLVDPVRIILFGSRARADARDDSDYDVLVLMDQVEHRRETRISIHRALADLEVPVDIVVATPSDVAAGRRGPRGIVQWAAEQGRVVYTRA